MDVYFEVAWENGIQRARIFHFDRQSILIWTLWSLSTRAISDLYLSWNVITARRPGWRKSRLRDIFSVLPSLSKIIPKWKSVERQRESVSYQQKAEREMKEEEWEHIKASLRERWRCGWAGEKRMKLKEAGVSKCAARKVTEEGEIG